MVWFVHDGSRVTLDVIKEFRNEAPRTVAIVGGAILDDCLATLIKAKLPVNGRTKDELFKSPGGAVSNFDTKIKLAYVMGIISKEAMAELYTIAEIRNKFAHRLDIADFEHSDIRSKCHSLKMIEARLFDQKDDPPEGPRFTIGIENLSERMSTIIYLTKVRWIPIFDSRS